MTTEPHEHDFGPVAERGRIGWCLVGGCNETRVATRKLYGPRDAKVSRWRPLTATEQLNLVAFMMEEMSLAQALKIIHGERRGMARFNYLRAGGPPA